MSRLPAYPLYFFSLALLLISIFFPTLTSAQIAYTPLIDLQGIVNINDTGFEAYLELLYILAISAAALIAVVRLMLAGLKYIGSEVITDIADAKKDIQNVLIGLGIILLATTILRTINPQLVNLAAIPNAPSYNDIYRPRVEVVRPPAVGEATLEQMRVVCAPRNPTVVILPGGRQSWICEATPEERVVEDANDIPANNFASAEAYTRHVAELNPAGTILLGVPYELKINADGEIDLDDLREATLGCTGGEQNGNYFEIAHLNFSGIQRSELLCFSKTIL